MKYRYYILYKPEIYQKSKESTLPSICDKFSDDYYGGERNYIFTSASYNNQKSIDLFNRMRTERNDFNIMGDSGGYQILTKKIEYSDEYREKTLHWLENYCDYSMLLDIPFSGYADFENAISQSEENFKFFAENKLGKTRFLNILHGGDNYQLKRWYKMMCKYIDNFDGGWAVPGKKNCDILSNTYIILLSLAYLYTDGILENMKEHEMIHLLGCTKPQILYLVFYFLYRIDFKGILSFDSSAVNINSYNMLLMKSILPYTCIRYYGDYSRICDCKMCQNKKLREMFMNDKSYEYPIVFGHNRKVYSDNINYISEIAKIDDLKECGILTTEIKKMLVYVNEMIENKKGAVDIIRKCEKIINLKNENFMIDDLF